MDTFRLDEFANDAWMERREYREYQGIGAAHLDAMHEARGCLLSREIVGELEHLAYVHLESVQFSVWIYEVNTWSAESAIRTLDPCFIAFGTTYDGIREIQACPAVNALPAGIIQQMQWLLAFCDAKGWREGE